MVFRVKAYTLYAYQAFGAVAGDGTTIFRLFFIFFSISNTFLFQFSGQQTYCDSHLLPAIRVELRNWTDCLQLVITSSEVVSGTREDNQSTHHQPLLAI